MSLKVGIVGLPNVGKSTLFNALLKKQVAVSANYPFTTIEPNVGVVEVPDDKLEKLTEVIEKSEGLTPGFKIVPAIVEFVDIAGLVKGAHKGEGLGNKFLSHIREVDAIVFVVRDFENGDIIKTGENPKDDLEVLKSELLLKDLEVLEKRVDTFSRELKPATPQDPRHEILKTIEKATKLAGEGKWLADELSSEELVAISDLQLLVTKKFIVVENCDESEVSNVSKVSEVSNEIAGAIRISAKMDEELAGLTADEQKEYLESVGVSEPGLIKLIRKAYEILGLMSFYTAGPKEVRAWTIKKGSTAPAAAGVIHTDFERGFIAADIVPLDKFIEVGGWKACRDKGLVKTIGKTELMSEDVVVEFKFSV